MFGINRQKEKFGGVLEINPTYMTTFAKFWSVQSQFRNSTHPMEQKHFTNMILKQLLFYSSNILPELSKISTLTAKF
jgi:hypothetical protein